MSQPTANPDGNQMNVADSVSAAAAAADEQYQAYKAYLLGLKEDYDGIVAEGGGHHFIFAADDNDVEEGDESSLASGDRS